MKIKCTEDRQEAAILVEKLKNDSRYTKAKRELSKFCRYLGKTNLRGPLCEDCRILQVQNSDGSVSISKKDVHTYTQVDTGQESTTARVCRHVPDSRWRGDGRALGMYPGVAGPHQNASFVCPG